MKLGAESRVWRGGGGNWEPRNGGGEGEEMNYVETKKVSLFLPSFSRARFLDPPPLFLQAGFSSSSSGGKMASQYPAALASMALWAYLGWLPTVERGAPPTLLPLPLQNPRASPSRRPPVSRM
ncbi:uncharacterized protein CLUP02_08117 [Colletotrichum lupini]|uniref:Uncharacterized protein n=1 Tax=Colletotrichum lupini TaxID=145971 RepID=A0A9Q8WH61_9PEZI|nr:uncharacterized protein CLUP02_08117 [Colletotrichum lupini]UQC82627.1 hypothetical protein CLUP02_08117 [Colletotrichum lupini]